MARGDVIAGMRGGGWWLVSTRPWGQGAHTAAWGHGHCARRVRQGRHQAGDV